MPSLTTLPPELTLTLLERILSLSDPLTLRSFILTHPSLHYFFSENRSWLLRKFVRESVGKFYVLARGYYLLSKFDTKTWEQEGLYAGWKPRRRPSVPFRSSAVRERLLSVVERETTWEDEMRIYMLHSKFESQFEGQQGRETDMALLGVYDTLFYYWCKEGCWGEIQEWVCEQKEKVMLSLETERTETSPQKAGTTAADKTTTTRVHVEIELEQKNAGWAVGAGCAGTLVAV